MNTRRDFLKAMGVGMAGACVSPGVRAAAQGGKRPNVILVMADDLGHESLGCYGGRSFETPLLDGVAAKGMRFTHCYSQPICTPSRVKIMTGRSNARNYVRFGHLDPKEMTFGHVMKRAGYKTCIAGKWQLCGGNDHDGSFPKESGFDESCLWAYHHDLPEDVRDKYTHFDKAPKKTSRFWNPAVVRNGEYVPTTTEDYGPDIYSDFVVDFLKRNRDEEFFVYYPMTLTHSPYLATPKSKNQSERAKTKSSEPFFKDMVQYTGHILDRIVGTLDELGIAENTLVLFTTDNGNGRTLVMEMDDRTVYGAKGLPIEHGVHAPLVAYWKGTIEPGSTCTDLVDFSDFLPTLAGLGSAPLPEDVVLDGRSFLPQLKGEPGNPRECVVVHYDKDPLDEKPNFRRIRFAYDGRYKLYLDGRMYQVPDDWLEEHPISEEKKMSGEQEAARKKLQAALDSLPEWTPDNSAHPGGSSMPLELYRSKTRRAEERKK